jgi:hypothetical protein
MAKIRYKTRALIRRFGSGPVVVTKALAKQYIDRGQAVRVKKSIVKVEDPVEETVEESQEVEVEVPDEVEEKVEVKIKKNKKE